MLESLFNKVTGLRPETLLKRDFFSCETCEAFKNTYFKEHLQTTASVSSRDTHKTQKNAAVYRYFKEKRLQKLSKIPRQNLMVTVLLVTFEVASFF